MNEKPYSVKKGDIIAIVETRVAQFVHGSRPAETSTTVRIVRVESASKDGVQVHKYRTYPGSPVYTNHYTRFKLLTIGGTMIGGTMQVNAQRLFNAATGPLDYDSQESARGAVLFA